MIVGYILSTPIASAFLERFKIFGGSFVDDRFTMRSVAVEVAARVEVAVEVEVVGAVLPPAAHADDLPPKLC
jgi:hypothetical protein